MLSISDSKLIRYLVENDLNSIYTTQHIQLACANKCSRNEDVILKWALIHKSSGNPVIVLMD